MSPAPVTPQVWVPMGTGIIGPKGDTGAQGPKGDTGAQGDPGPAGAGGGGGWTWLAGSVSACPSTLLSVAPGLRNARDTVATWWQTS